MINQGFTFAVAPMMDRGETLYISTLYAFSCAKYVHTENEIAGFSGINRDF